MSFALITLDISDYFPQNFRFDNFSFIFSSDGHDFEDEINYLSRNQIVHKALLNKKDIRYSIKILKNDSLIGISDFIIPSVLLSRKEQFFEKVCVINMTDSTKRILFGNLSQSNTLRINIKANMQYIQEKAMIKQNTAGLKKDKNKPFSPKSTNLGVKKKNLPISSATGVGNNPTSLSGNNPNSNFVFNKQSISSRKGIGKNNNNVNNNVGNKIQNKFNNNNNKQNMADIMLQQQQQQRLKNNFINNTNNNNIKLIINKYQNIENENKFDVNEIKIESDNKNDIINNNEITKDKKEKKLISENSKLKKELEYSNNQLEKYKKYQTLYLNLLKKVKSHKNLINNINLNNNNNIKEQYLNDLIERRNEINCMLKEDDILENNLKDILYKLE